MHLYHFRKTANMESIEYKGTKTDFVKMAMECKMPWETLTLILNDLAPTLNKIREVISILLKELEGLQLALKEKDKELEMYQNSGSSEDAQYISLETELQSSVMEIETMDDKIAVLELPTKIHWVDITEESVGVHCPAASIEKDYLSVWYDIC